MLRPAPDFAMQIARANLTIKTLAEAAGVSRFTIHKWFQPAQPEPRLDVAWRIATAYAKAANIPDARDAFNQLFIEQQEPAGVAA